TNMALPPHDQRHQYLRYTRLLYTYADIVDFEMRLARIYMREVHRVQVFDFGGLSNFLADGLSARVLMEHKDAQGFQLGRARKRPSWRQFIVALGLHTREEMKSPALSYTTIRDSILRLCHRLIACSIVVRIQAPEKVIVTDLFYLREMDVGSVNVPYLLARYLRLFVAGRKSRAYISGGQFIYMGVNDTWAWVAMGPKRQPDAMAGALRVAQDVHVVDKGVQAIPAPMQAPQQPLSPPPVAARTMPQRLGRLEEEVKGLCRDVGSLRRLAFDGTFRGSSLVAFQRRTRQRTGEANTSTAQQDQHQPDP
ncbi:hypothetical protein Tco_1131228, partial [Tanacetum coccineum]